MALLLGECYLLYEYKCEIGGRPEQKTNSIFFRDLFNIKRH